MASNKIYLLERIIEVQEIVIREKKHGRYQNWIYENLIKDQFHISFSTFNNYMCTNARRELAILKEKRGVACQ